MGHTRDDDGPDRTGEVCVNIDGKASSMGGVIGAQAVEVFALEQSLLANEEGRVSESFYGVGFTTDPIPIIGPELA